MSILSSRKQTKNWKTLTEEENISEFFRLCINLEIVLRFCKFEPCGSYKKNSCKKDCVKLNYRTLEDAYLRDVIHTHFVTLIGKWTISFLPTHPVFLSALARNETKLLWFYFTHSATLIGPMLDPLTHNRPFADKRDLVGMDCVPKMRWFTNNEYIGFKGTHLLSPLRYLVEYALDWSPLNAACSSLMFASWG